MQTSPVVSEFRAWYGDYVSAVTRLYGDKEYAAIEWTVGPLPG